jgi:hypothetical protein
VSKACPHCGYRKPIKVPVVSVETEREERYLDLLVYAAKRLSILSDQVNNHPQDLIHTFIYGVIAGCTAEIVTFFIGKGSL